MKKLLMMFGVMLLCSKAHAYMEVVEVYRSTATVGSVKCSSGTASRIDAAPVLEQGLMGNGYSRAGIRLHTFAAANEVYIGFNNNVSSDVTKSNAGFPLLGSILTTDATLFMPIGRDIQVWCIANDASGANGVRISVQQFGYR